MLTETPPSWSGNGTAFALKVAGASDDPKIVSTAPGAKPWRKDAPFARFVMEGVPLDDATLIVMDALAGLYELSPLYCAAIESVPTASCDPAIVRLADADPPDPLSVAEPSDAPL